MRRFLVHLRQDLHQIGHRSTEPGEGLRRHGSLPRKTWSLSVPRTRQPDPLLRLPTWSSGARRILASASRIADSRVEGVAICVSQAARREVDSKLRGRSGRHVSGFGATRRQFRR